MTRHLFAALLCSVIASSPLAAATRFQSGPATVALIELYTSEGCSSCPPADAWLNHLQDAPGLWHRFIPVAFHVDYWDELGWIDPFDNAAFSNRQRGYYHQGQLSGIYTPGMLYQGHEYQGWRQDAAPPEVPLPQVGTLDVQVEGHRINVSFSPTARSTTPLRATAALLGFGLISKVPNGENAGRTLHHDFVNLGQNAQLATPNDDYYRWRLSIPTAKVNTATHLGLVVWISPAHQETPIQAAGGYLTKTR